MASVTVAGGSFDGPARVRSRGDGATQERRLRRVLGASVVGLLAANGITLASMIDRAVTDATRRAETAATARPATSDAAASPAGEGFASFEVPSDLSVFGSAGVVAASEASPVAAAAVAPVDPADPGALHVLPADPTAGAPATVHDPAGPPRDAPPPPAGEVPDLPSTGSLLGPVADVVSGVPVVGEPVAEVIETAESELEPVVEAVAGDEAVETTVATVTTSDTTDTSGTVDTTADTISTAGGTLG